METGRIAGRQPRQRVGGCRRDGIEDSEQRVGEALFIAGDQLLKGAALNAVQIAERL